MAGLERTPTGELPVVERVVSQTQVDLPGLYETHYRRLVKLASFYTDDTETAEEVVQDAFVKLLNGNYRIDSNAGAYLRSMVLNGARSQLRKRKVRRDYVPDVPRPVDAAEVGGVAAAASSEIVAALRSLPQKQSAVLVLRYFLDLSEADIAQTLGIARGSVKSHASRGLAKLARTIPELQA
ncbi:MAG: SigE family RNA polymerase sigma factor [Acidimicrobiales bacterium]|nr:SigE family RNA polymerase sigma factor [Acidimicrobiales bacterium]